MRQRPQQPLQREELHLDFRPVQTTEQVLSQLQSCRAIFAEAVNQYFASREMLPPGEIAHRADRLGLPIFCFLLVMAYCMI